MARVSRRITAIDVWCPKCSREAGTACVGVGDHYSLLYPPIIKRPHRERCAEVADLLSRKKTSP